jgi:DNA segregation ATPase FtsK/SpoIIIE-like protein
MLQPPSSKVPGLDEDMDDNFKEAVEVVVQYDRASPALLQRRLGIGYARAARLVDQLETAGVVGPADGAKPREVLIRSVDEILENGNEPQGKQNDPFEVPSNYKVPTDLHLSKGDKIYPREFISDVVNSRVLKETKVRFPIPLGFDEKGELRLESFLNIKNLILAGNPLSNKENFVDTLLLTYLLRYKPSEIRFILNDPTHYLDLYEGIPHLLSPVISTHDKMISALKWAQYEMERRQKQFSQAGVRDIKAFNEKSGGSVLPQILIITRPDFIDIEIEDAITVLTARGIRTGIFNSLVVDQTQGIGLPSPIKSNIPARIAFRMTSSIEARSIDLLGAEKLEPGEIIYKPNYGEQEKLKALFTPEANVKEVVEAIKSAS